jgi:hypothetical protein
MLTLSNDELVKLCQQLDNAESDLRGIERQLTNLRFRLRRHVPANRRADCGFDESQTEASRTERHGGLKE